VHRWIGQWNRYMDIDLTPALGRAVTEKVIERGRKDGSQ
jgi:hypothetical protein